MAYSTPPTTNQTIGRYLFPSTAQLRDSILIAERKVFGYEYLLRMCLVLGYDLNQNLRKKEREDINMNMAQDGVRG